MKHRWAALVIVLALVALVPGTGTAQDSTSARSRERTPGFGLGQNYPNPFNPTTTIPFTIGDQPCTNTGGGRRYRVSLRIYNVLAQIVAVPILQGGDEAAGQPLENLQLGCGPKSAFWNGNYLNQSREVASGIYLYRLEVDGRAIVKKMIVIK